VDSNKDYRAGYIAIIGKPNVGKSTLLNKLLNTKLSIVTPKPQTTRKKIIGVLNSKNCQMIFIDTPGIITPNYSLQEIMMKYIDSAIRDADIIVYMVDAVSYLSDFNDKKNKYISINKPLILVINKIDLVDKKALLPLIDKYRKVYQFAAYIPISAYENDGLNRLIDKILDLLPISPPYYPTEYLTDRNERFFVSEIIREKIFKLYGEEIPYSCHVHIEEYKENLYNKDYIRAIIYVDQLSQKSILIGKGGKALKKVGELARKDIEIFLEREVFLELYVKLMKDWRKKSPRLKNFGY
jgi:GTP-binding protein Era